MPIFHQHKLVFVHIPKNAGKSVEGAFLGDGAPHLGRRSPLNKLFKGALNLTEAPHPRRDLLGSLNFTFAAQHMTLREMTDLALVSEDTCPGYRSFAVVRNPYDRAVSSVLHHLGTSGKSVTDAPGFERAFREWLDTRPTDHNLIAHRRSQFAFVTLDEQTIAVDDIIRFESLGEDIARLCARHGLPEVTLGWSGKATRSRDYHDYFNAASRAALKTAFGVDLEQFEYAY